MKVIDMADMYADYFMVGIFKMMAIDTDEISSNDNFDFVRIFFNSYTNNA